MTSNHRPPLARILLLAACLAGSFPAWTPALAAAPNRFTILQINDTYKIEGLEKGTVGGFARLRTLRRQLEADGRKVLLLHGGDLLYPSVMSKYLRAEPIIRILNLLDGDAAAFDPDFIATFGNHEFDNPDPAILLGRTAQSDFSWVSSNVRYRSDRKASGEPLSTRIRQVHDLMIHDMNGFKLGLFGLTVAAQTQDYVAYDDAPEARRALVRTAIAELKAQGARMIIALTHEDLAQDEWMAREFPDIDLVIGGHEHFFIREQIGHTWITKADADCQSAAVYDIEAAPDRPVKIELRKVKLDGTIAKDPRIAAEVDQYLVQLDQTLKARTGRDGAEIFGYTDTLLEGTEIAVRGRETALGDFLADVIRERMQADLAFVNGGGIRINDNILPGPITHYDLEGIFYYDNHLVSFELTGAQVLDILRNSVARVRFGDGRFLQVSGIRFKYHKSGTAEAPRHSIEERDVEVLQRGSRSYAPLDRDQVYKVGTTDFIWASGYRDGYALFGEAAGGTSPKRLDGDGTIGFRKAAEEALARLPRRTVTTRVEGRIVAVDE